MNNQSPTLSFGKNGAPATLVGKPLTRNAARPQRGRKATVASQGQAASGTQRESAISTLKCSKKAKLLEWVPHSFFVKTRVFAK